MAKRALLTRLLPITSQLEGYGRENARVDMVAGLTVALVLIPQSMAYAQLAGLPPYYGLYAACIPPVVASLFGSSAQLATGPVAVVSLMTATALGAMAAPGSSEFIALAIMLALLVGIFQLILGLLRMGLIINLLSHPVVNGFTNAAALIIATSQLGKLLGVTVEKGDHHYETVLATCAEALHDLHWPTLAMGIGALVLMIVLRRIDRRIPCVLVAVVATTVISWATGFERISSVPLHRIASERATELILSYNRDLERSGELGAQRRKLAARERKERQRLGEDCPAVLELRHRLELLDLELEESRASVRRSRQALRRLVFVGVPDSSGALHFYSDDELPAAAAATGRRWKIRVGNGPLNVESIRLSSGGAVVGAIPRGLPGFRVPALDPAAAITLLPMVVIISILGFMEAISIAKAMAARTGQRLDPNQELVGQGLSNIVGSFASSYPVSGSFSRSAVNLQAGARTGLSNVFASAVVLVTLLFLTPLLYHLPQAVLASIIMMAVIGLIDFKALVHAWKAQPHDGLIAGITFVGTLAWAPHLEKGIFLGVALSLALYLFRTMKPDVALLSMAPDGAFRNAARHALATCQRIAVIRFNGSLFFSNVSALEDQVLERVASLPDLEHVLLVGNGINEIDSSGVEMLRQLVKRLREAGFEFSISGLNDSVLETFRRTGLYELIGEQHIFRSVSSALESIWEATHFACDEGQCPLIQVRFKGLDVARSVKKRPEILKGPPRRTEKE